jgi:CubicO group peptidase (beta-lactamase class C family)
MEAFFDGIIAGYLEQNHIAGATLAVVRNGGVVLRKGYGFADVDTRRAVSPDSTLFRIGSISKMFTWISVMQLVAQGKLDLETDINTYLDDFKVPEAFGQPVTLRHLMTHTPGFEDHLLNLFARDSTGLRSLGEVLRDEMPARVRPPYTQSSYSNHGTGLAAYIVERVSGLTFHDYVEKNILGPLEMNMTTFRQPLPLRMRPFMSRGYRFEDRLVEQGFEYVPLYPVGSASTTAADMTHFMLALLDHGRWGGKSILDSATLARMQQPAHRHHARLNPMRLGFMDVSQNGVEVIGHGGDTFWFHSAMVLFPAQNLGVFMSFNADGGGEAYWDITEKFIDRYFPDDGSGEPVRVSFDWLERFAGEYEANRHPYDDITKIASLSGRTKIEVVDSTKLKVTSGEESTVFVALDSTTFREEFASDRIAFGLDDRGEVRYMYIGGLPILAMEKVSGWPTSGIQLLVTTVVAVTMLCALIYWPLAARIRRNYQPLVRAKAKLPFIVKSAAWANYLFYLLFLAGVAIGMSGGVEIIFGVPGAMKFGLACALLMIPATLIMVLFLVQMLRDHRYSRWSKTYYAWLTMVSILALVQLNYWNFLGFNY